MAVRQGTLPIHVHRLYPWDKWSYSGVSCLGALGAAFYVWPRWEFTLACILFAAGCFVRLCATPFILLEASSLGLRIIKRSPIPFPPQIEVLRSREIRRVRYRLEKVVDPDSDSDTYTRIYILDLVTTDSRILTLMRAKNFSFDASLGSNIAHTLGVAYEEYLDDN